MAENNKNSGRLMLAKIASLQHRSKAAPRKLIAKTLEKHGRRLRTTHTGKMDVSL